MTRDERTYIKLHDGMPEHPKIEGLTDAAFRGLIDLWCWCSRNLTDGKVANAVWTKRASSKVRRELLAAGLVHEADDGVQMHDYTEHQRTAAEVAELKEKRREAGSRGGRAKARQVASAKASASRGAKQTPSKSVAETDTELPEPKGSGSATAQTLISEWIDGIGERPPRDVVGQAAKKVSDLLREGRTPDEIRDGLSLLAQKRTHPSTLPSLVFEAKKGPQRNGRPDPDRPGFWGAVDRNAS